MFVINNCLRKTSLHHIHIRLPYIHTDCLVILVLFGGQPILQKRSCSRFIPVFDKLKKKAVAQINLYICIVNIKINFLIVKLKSSNQSIYMCSNCAFELLFHPSRFIRSNSRYSYWKTPFLQLGA